MAFGCPAHVLHRSLSHPVIMLSLSRAAFRQTEDLAAAKERQQTGMSEGEEEISTMKQGLEHGFLDRLQVGQHTSTRNP